MNKTTAGVIEQQCSTCRYYHCEECHFASPNAINGVGYWPKVHTENWCGRWKKPSEFAPASARATDAAIMAMMDVAGEIGEEEFALAIAGEFGIHEKSAHVKLHRLVARRKLAVGEAGKLSLALPAAKKKAAEHGVSGRPVKNEFPKWQPALAGKFGDLERAGLFSELRAAAKEFESISDASFSYMLKRAIAAGQVAKVEDAAGKGRYWVPAAAVAPTSLVAMTDEEEAAWAAAQEKKEAAEEAAEAAREEAAKTARAAESAAKKQAEMKAGRIALWRCRHKFGRPEDAVFWQPLNDAANAFGRMSDTTFNAVLQEARAARAVLQTPEGKYWFAPELSAGIELEAPELP